MKMINPISSVVGEGRPLPGFAYAGMRAYAPFRSVFGECHEPAGSVAG